MDENLDTDSNEGEDTTHSKEVDQLSKEKADVAVELKVDDGSESVKVNLTNIPLISYAPKASTSSASSGMKQSSVLCLRCLLLKEFASRDSGIVSIV